MLDFPDSPVANDTFGASNGVTYTFDGTKWTVSGSSVGPYLLLAGGTMTGPVALAADPTTDPQAANKHYVDASINLAGNYLGTWSVASNTPNINAGGSISNANYVATTVNPATPEIVPVGVPGIAGMTVANGDRIIWASGLGVWQILRNAGVTLAAADARYYAITNPSGYQTAAQVTAVLRYPNYVDNSGFAVNQRAYVSGAASTAGTYMHDRWKAGAGGCTYTFAQSSGPSTTVTITAGTLQQVVEGAGLAAGTYMLSWTGTAQGRVGAGSYAASPVTAAGITAGANTTIEFNAGTLANVKFEAGTVATPWTAPKMDDTLTSCLRFYWRGQVVAAGSATAGVAFIAPYSLPMPMRAATPSIAITDYSSCVNLSGVAINPVSAPASNRDLYCSGTVVATGAVTLNLVFTVTADL